MNGYHGQFLKVDLSTGQTESMPVSDELLKKFVGGASLAAALIYDSVEPGMDPLGPASPLVFAAGPLTASP
jgi:aldehyde:ferredoxin oxidoreductase